MQDQALSLAGVRGAGLLFREHLDLWIFAGRELISPERRETGFANPQVQSIRS